MLQATTVLLAAGRLVCFGAEAWFVGAHIHWLCQPPPAAPPPKVPTPILTTIRCKRVPPLCYREGQLMIARAGCETPQVTVAATRAAQGRVRPVSPPVS
jgi:hypothetical protein